MRKPGKSSRERNADFCSNHNDDEDKYFFKVLVGDFRERLVSLQVHYVLGKCSFFNFCCHHHLCVLRSADIVLAIICATKTKSQKKPEWKDLASCSCRCRLKPKIYLLYYCSELLKLYMQILTGMLVQPENVYWFFNMLDVLI